MDLDRFVLQEAQLCDKEGVLEISVGIYEGEDYIPNCYDYWIRLSQSPDIRLKNYGKTSRDWPTSSGTRGPDKASQKLLICCLNFNLADDLKGQLKYMLIGN